MKITADDIRSWACSESCEYIAVTYPDGVEVNEPFLRRWAAGDEWRNAKWTDLARAAVQVNPSVVFVIANMALEYAARLNPSLAPYVGTVMDESSSVAAWAAAWTAAEAARATEEEAVAEWAAEAVRAAEWAVRAVRAAEEKTAAAWMVEAAEAAEAAGEEAKERIIALCIATILGGER